MVTRSRKVKAMQQRHSQAMREKQIRLANARGLIVKCDLCRREPVKTNKYVLKDGTVQNYCAGCQLILKRAKQRNEIIKKQQDARELQIQTRRAYNAKRYKDLGGKSRSTSEKMAVRRVEKSKAEIEKQLKAREEKMHPMEAEIARQYARESEARRKRYV